MKIIFLLLALLICVPAWAEKHGTGKALKFDASYPSVTITEVYSVMFANQKELYEYCKKNELDQKINELDQKIIEKHFAMGLNLIYLDKNSKYNGMEFYLKIKSCDDLPEHSICIDKQNCFIKYTDDDKS